MVLQVLCSGDEVDVEVFNRYGLETAEYFLSLYSWYKLPPTVHKILLHGSKVIEHLPLPIGTLSEEAQEARNKTYRNYREHHTRKTSRADTIRDTLNMLLVSSDPVINCGRQTRGTSTELHPDAKKLLKTGSNDSDLENAEDFP